MDLSKTLQNGLSLKLWKEIKGGHFVVKKIWQLACLENNYDSHSSYFRDMVRYFSYTLLALLLFF